MVCQLHSSREESIPEDHHHHPEDHWMPSPLPGRSLQFLLPQKAQKRKHFLSKSYNYSEHCLLFNGRACAMTASRMWTYIWCLWYDVCYFSHFIFCTIYTLFVLLIYFVLIYVCSDRIASKSIAHVQ